MYVGSNNSFVRSMWPGIAPEGLISITILLFEVLSACFFAHTVVSKTLASTTVLCLSQIMIQALRSSLENCQQKLAKSQETTRLLHLEHSQQLKAIKKEQVSALENLRNTLMEDHKKVCYLTGVWHTCRMYSTMKKNVHVLP